mgnify:CR=1 FL=1
MGNFDGVHLGHRAMIERLRELEARGVTGVSLRVQAPDRRRFLEIWRDEVMPALG